MWSGTYFAGCFNNVTVVSVIQAYVPVKNAQKVSFLGSEIKRA